MEIGEVLLTISAGADGEANEAFTWLFKTCWEEVLGVLKSKEQLCGLILEERESAVLQAFQELWQKARAGKISDLDRDPRALLHTIAFRRAIEFIRRNTAKKRTLTHAVEEELKSAIQNSSFDLEWRYLERRDLAMVVIKEFLSWMRKQSGICRRTAFVMAEFFPDIASPKELLQYLSEQLEVPPTYESVKKARADVLAKFLAVIKQKYNA